MESLSDTPWDVVIEGTGLRQSLLALALSRSDKKILHVDQNEYYGGAEAAFSLQEIDEWVEKIAGGTPDEQFRNASLWKAESSETEKLSFSRAYTLTLSPQIIYTKSNLLGRLVASKVYRQLEFQAVGNWWIYHAEKDSQAILKRLPNGREDIFEDKSIDLRAKRSLMKFLKFVVDYDNQLEIWESHAGTSFSEFLASQFKLPAQLQTIISALTLSLDSPEQTTVGYALPRVARHLTSIGVFGPGFGAVVPKWGGGAEIAQVACRACAVGGGVYVLGTGIISSKVDSENSIQVTLSNDEVLKTQILATGRRADSITLNASQTSRSVSKTIALVSSPLTSLFETSVEGAPTAAVSVVVIPPGTLTTNDLQQDHPVYIMVHSSESGECPVGQCVFYATTLFSTGSKAILDAAMSAFVGTVEGGTAKLLYSLYYEQQQAATGSSDSLDLAFNDGMLNDVEKEWKDIMGVEASVDFMQFEDRAGMNGDDDNDNDEL